MRNQTSFRLTSTLLPTDTTATTTTVINKVDSNGDKFYPTFTEETVVLTNDDRTVMETTRAICTDGALTFTKRGLSDDNSETQVPNRKLTWNPGTLAFITAGAGDWIDKDDSITWTGNQTYTGNLTSQGTATYAGRLITQKGVEYPHFDSLEDLQAYNDPFGGMFAVVDSDGELYRYNDVTDTWSVVTTSTPAQPAQASTVAIGTVRGATDVEFAAGTAKGSNDELLVATPAQILSVTPTMDLHLDELIDVVTESILTVGSISLSFNVTHAGFITVVRTQYISTASKADNACCNYISYSGASCVRASSSRVFSLGTLGDKVGFKNTELIAVAPGTFTATLTNDYAIPSGIAENRIKFSDFFYFG